MSAAHNDSSSACKLCSKINSKRKSLRDMKEHKQFHIVFEWLHENELSLNETDYICLPCVKQIQRGHNKPSFIPRWIPKTSIPKKKCCMEYCQAELHTHTTIASIEEVENILKKSRSIHDF